MPAVSPDRRRALACLAAAAFNLLVPACGEAEEAAPPKQTFLRDLQQALRNDDRGWIADHLRYPLRHHGRVANVIRNRSDFVRNYAGLISDRLRAAVLAQQPDKVFENWQGLMIGDGTHNMWVRDTASGDVARFRIVTINNSD